MSFESNSSSSFEFIHFRDRTKRPTKTTEVSLCVELLARLGIVQQDRRREKVVPVSVGIPHHCVAQLLCPHRVHHAERAAAKRGEADAKDGADVCVFEWHQCRRVQCTG